MRKHNASRRKRSLLREMTGRQWYYTSSNSDNSTPTSSNSYQRNGWIVEGERGAVVRKPMHSQCASSSIDGRAYYIHPSQRPGKLNGRYSSLPSKAAATPRPSTFATDARTVTGPIHLQHRLLSLLPSPPSLSSTLRKHHCGM